MNDVRNKYVPPAIDELAFNCPHCGALTQQSWYRVRGAPLKKDHTPFVMTQEEFDNFPLKDIEDPQLRAKIDALNKRTLSGRPFLSDERKDPFSFHIYNAAVGQCFNCGDITIWLHNRMIWPQLGMAPLPNPDLPDDIRDDYGEASIILDLSPRGAAAMLRLAIQKLCVHLGEKGKNINDDIAALVAKGLDIKVQQSLDIVRVVGNNAVHPGQIDLKDDRATAEKLFALVNLIAEIMISQPKHVAVMYGSLPPSARKAIEERDKKKK